MKSDRDKEEKTSNNNSERIKVRVASRCCAANRSNSSLQPLIQSPLLPLLVNNESPFGQLLSIIARVTRQPSLL